MFNKCLHVVNFELGHIEEWEYGRISF